MEPHNTERARVDGRYFSSLSIGDREVVRIDWGQHEGSLRLAGAGPATVIDMVVQHVAAGAQPLPMICLIHDLQAQIDYLKGAV